MGRRSSIYITEELHNRLGLDNRGISQAINETLDRYDELIESERRRVEQVFSESEWNAMRNACNGTLWQPAAIIRDGVYANIQDSLDDEIEYYGADRAELEEKLRELSVLQQFALVEMIEEWWSNQ